MPAVIGGSGSGVDGIQRIRDAGAMARIRIDAAPRSVEVVIDERPVSQGAPVEIQTSATIQHRLILRSPGFLQFATDLTLKPGELRRLQVVLART